MLTEKIKKFLLWLANPTGLIIATIPALALTYLFVIVIGLHFVGVAIGTAHRG